MPSSRVSSKKRETEIVAKDLVIEILSRGDTLGSESSSEDGMYQEKLVQALALRSFHLPGNSYFNDWLQYILNNHLVFGLCCRHRLHPIGPRMRVINLLGSALFGLLVTSVIWLSYIYYDRDPYSVLFEVPLFRDSSVNNSTNTALSDGIPLPETTSSQAQQSAVSDDGDTFQVTKGMILLWTLGSAFHATYDSLIWYITACACCLPGSCCERLEKFRVVGKYMATVIVILVAASAAFAVVLRATLVSSDESVDQSDFGSAGIVDDSITVSEINDLGGFEFVLGYLVELLSSLFLFDPLVGTILFTGCLGCGNIPYLGGRPYEIKMLQAHGAEV